MHESPQRDGVAIPQARVRQPLERAALDSGDEIRA